MLNLLSILFAILALPVMLVGLIPFFGWLNYLAAAIAVVGLALGVLANGKTGRNLNIVVLVIGGVRLWLGGGIL